MTTTNPTGVELSHSRRMLILAVCCISLFIVGLDITIVNVALPSIQRSLHASVSGLQWTLDAYTLVLASLLMLSGSTADRLGRKRVFQTGLLLFTAGSLLCSVAPNLELLVVFRMLQAVGGSMLNPVAMSIITNTFTEPKERARAIGIWGGVVGISLALGPVVGGALVGGIGWRSIFWINIPVGIAAVVLTQKFIPESKAARVRRIDPVGQLLIIVLLAAITGGIIEAPDMAGGSPFILGLFALGIAALASLIRVETRRREPLLDMRFFRSAPFSGATVIAVAAFASLGAFLFLNTLYLQDVRGFSPLHAGLLTVPMAAMAMLFAPLSGRLVGSVGPRTPLVFAGPCLAIGAGLLLRLTPTTSIGYLVVAYAIFGIGFGLVNAPITNTAVSGMPRDQAGVAAGVASTSRQIGSTLGVAVTGSLIAVGAGANFTQSSHAAWAVVTGCGVVTFLIGLLSTGSWAARTADRNRELLLPQPAEVAGDRRLSPSADLASRVWAALSGFVENEEHARREALAETLGLGRGRGRLKVLRAVAAGPLSLREIADAVRVDAPYATVIVDNLETVGLVRRMPHPDDRRRKLVSLTEGGIEALCAAESFFTQAPTALARLDEDQLTRLAELVEHLVAG